METERARPPVYQQLLASLRTLVRNGDFAEGDRFLTERQVSDRYSVSRPTANKALASLVAEGILEFRKGVGTFVRGRGLDYDLGALVSFTHKAIAAGKRPQTQVLAFETIAMAQAPVEIQIAMDLPLDTAVHYMERLRLADNLPVILERRHLVAAFCPDLDRRTIHGSLYDYLTQVRGLQLGDSEQRIRAVHVQGSDARLLAARSGQACLEVDCKAYTQFGDLLWVERTLYRGDIYEFRQARPTHGRHLPGTMADRLT